MKDKKSKKLKKLLFLTGTRADFGKLEPLAIAARDSGYEVTFFVTGMHMMAKYGLTKFEVHKNWDSNSVVEYLNHREADSQDIILAKTIVGFSDFLKEYVPDAVIVHGDRVEALAACTVCAINYVRCIHIEGGEVSGTIDEQFRHCNTKLANHHLVCSQDAKVRVLKLGEHPDSITVIGSPELDQHAKDSGVKIKDVRVRYKIPDVEYGICIFHPVTSEYDTIEHQASSLFDALKESKRFFVVILPNNDPGASHIFKTIETLPSDYFRVLPSMRFNYFSELVKNSSIVVGNSSMGVREAPFLGISSLDIGTRQMNRSNASSIKTLSALDKESILKHLNESWSVRHLPNENFGSGNAAIKFVKFLKSELVWQTHSQKYFVD